MSLLYCGGKQIQHISLIYIFMGGNRFLFDLLSILNPHLLGSDIETESKCADSLECYAAETLRNT